MVSRTQIDDLPNAAHIDDKVLAEIYGVSTATIWRRSRLGQLPKPVRFSTRCTRWNVGTIRAHLKSLTEGGAQ